MAFAGTARPGGVTLVFALTLAAGCFNPSSASPDTDDGTGGTDPGTSGPSTSMSATSSMTMTTNPTETGETTSTPTSSTTNDPTMEDSGSTGDPGCEAGDFACDGDVLQTCNDGVFETFMRCDPGLCDAAGGQCDLCVPETAQCDSPMESAVCSADGQSWNTTVCDVPTPFCGSAGACVECLGAADCPSAPTCEIPACTDEACGTEPDVFGVDCGFPNVCDGMGLCAADPRKLFASAELGLRSFDGGATIIELGFSRVFPTTEDRFVLHFDISDVPDPVPDTVLVIELDNLDSGGADGIFGMNTFQGDGVASPDEWNAGTQTHQVSGINGNYYMGTVDFTSRLQQAVDANAPYLSIVFRGSGGATDRLNFGIAGYPSPYFQSDEPLQ